MMMLFPEVQRLQSRFCDIVRAAERFKNITQERDISFIILDEKNPAGSVTADPRLIYNGFAQGLSGAGLLRLGGPQGKDNRENGPLPR